MKIQTLCIKCEYNSSKFSPVLALKGIIFCSGKTLFIKSTFDFFELQDL